MLMHDDEFAIDTSLVSRLLSDQLPHLSALPIVEIRSTGTVNAVYRIGDHLVARLPRVVRWADDLIRELRWLPEIGPQLSIRVPRPVHSGSPTQYFPMVWALYEWVDGSVYSDESVEDEVRTARALAGFVRELRGIDPAGAPPAGRRPVVELDEVTRDAISASSRFIDSRAAHKAWATALQAPRWDGAPVWIHSDLLRPNLLVEKGRLTAIIDWGGAGVGDPAADVIAAWSVLGSQGRQVFREELAVDDDTWNRARGLALHQAAMIIPYYRLTNPGFVRTAVRIIREIVAEP